MTEPHVSLFADRLTGKKNSAFRLLDASVSPGEHASLGLPGPELMDYAPLYMPIKVINGKKEGPVLLLFATMRGDEFNGMEIVKRVIGSTAMEHLAGTIIAVPVLNVYGLLNRTPYAPGDMLLEQYFPGSPDGNYAERLAHQFMETLFSRCDFCIEICSGPLNHRVLPHLYADFDIPGNEELATNFPISVIVNTDSTPQTPHGEARKRGTPMLSYRAGEALRASKGAIRYGTRGILHLLRSVGMLPDAPEKPDKQRVSPVVCDANEWVYAPKSGISKFHQSLGDRVSRGQTIASISHPLTGAQDLQVNAPIDGVVVGANELPLVYEGDCLLRIASFPELDQAADALQAWSKGQTARSEAPGNPEAPANL